MTATRKLWIFLFGLLLTSFTVLLWVGGEIHRVMPPIPKAVLSDSGTVVYTHADIDEGRQVDVAGEGALCPGLVEIAPFGKVPGGFTQFIERFAAIALGTPGETREGTGQGGRGRGQAAFDPTAKHAGENAQGVGLRQFLEYRVDARLHGAAP